MAARSALESAFALAWRLYAPDAPEPVAEYRFAPPRRFRLDFAWVPQRVGVELQGGTFTVRHDRREGAWALVAAAAATLAEAGVGAAQPLIRMVTMSEEG